MRIITVIFIVLFSSSLIAQVKVKTVSAMKPVMMGEDLSAHVSLDTLTQLPHLYAVCPLNRLQGEVTIIDGEIYKSTVNSKGQIETSRTFEGTAPFMVYTQVDRWIPIKVSAFIQSENDLQALIEKVAKENGIDTESAFPFKVEGKFDTVRFHIISKPLKEKKHNHELHDKAKKHFIETSIKGTLVGFFSKHHQGVFTHRGSFTHVHFLDQMESMTGHLENITVDSELTICIPSNVQGLGDLQIETLDTDFSKGRLKNHQTAHIEDLVKFHGHLCDGLVLGFIGMKEVLFKLFPDSLIDRTNVRVVSRSSPCITDAGIYLSGGRYQFNTFYVSDSIEYLYVVQRIDNEKAFGIKTKQGLVPAEIKLLGAKALKGELDACQLNELRTLEDNFIIQLLNAPSEDLFESVELQNFVWKSPLPQTFLKTDVLNKNKPGCE
jgi:acetolactate decarboxylase